MYDGINERVVDGRGLRYDGGDGLGVRRQDASVPGRGTNRSDEFTSCVCFLVLAARHKNHRPT